MSSLHSVHSKHYFKSIDGLRLVAAVNIILFHLVEMGGLCEMNGCPAWFFTVIKAPAFHASLFFILAGFIYTVKYASRVDEFKTRHFFWTRLKNLYPLHAVTTLSMVPFVLMGNEVNFSLIKKLVFSLFMHLSLLWPFFPFYSYSLNMPSWALASFFFCYIMFAPVLKIIVKMEKKKLVFSAMGLCVAVSLLWGQIFNEFDFKSGYYMFFHIFTPVRFFEFVFGMLLARLYQISTHRYNEKGTAPGAILNDIYITLVLVSIYLVCAFFKGKGPFLSWISYHSIRPVLFAVLIYRFARGIGFFAKMMAVPFVRDMGKASFYPYLLHIPLISWMCFLIEKFFGYRKFLHYPLNIALIIIFLYSMSAIYFKKMGKKKRKSYVTGK